MTSNDNLLSTANLNHLATLRRKPSLIVTQWDDDKLIDMFFSIKLATPTSDDIGYEADTSVLQKSALVVLSDGAYNLQNLPKNPMVTFVMTVSHMEATEFSDDVLFSWANGILRESVIGRNMQFHASKKKIDLRGIHLVLGVDERRLERYVLGKLKTMIARVRVAKGAKSPFTQWKRVNGVLENSTEFAKKRQERLEAAMQKAEETAKVVIPEKVSVPKS